MRKTALVIGATGVSGRTLVDHLATLDDWEIYGVSRSRPDWDTRAKFVSVDLLDAAAAKRELAVLDDVTHVFYTGFINKPTWIEQRAPNTALLVNAIEAIEPVAKRLEHVCLLQGTKYYGAHLGAFRTPAREDQARHFPPNFYYDQQDFLTARQKGKRWSWSCARPHTICGYALGNPLNLISVLGVYATISRELSLPLRFPGKPAAFRSIYQVTDADLLAKAMVWMATAPQCANQAYNVINGDYVRFEHLWPLFADYFDMEPGPIHTIDLQLFMSDKEPLWQDIVAKYGLARNPFARVADWSYGNYAFAFEWDIMSDMMKARRHGFHEYVSTDEMFVKLFDRLRAEHMIPAAQQLRAVA